MMKFIFQSINPGFKFRRLNFSCLVILLNASMLVQAGSAIVQNKVSRDLLKFESFNQTSEVIANRPTTDFITIGADANCDVDSAVNGIQNVIETGIAEIRVASNGTYFNTLVINNQSVVIRGGFADCMEAENNNQTITDLTPIDGNFIAAPVIRITGIGLPERQIVRLENLRIIGGTSLAGALGGGLSLDETELELQMLRVQVENNSGSAVAGMYINDGIGINTADIDIFAQDVVIVGNDAVNDAGGIFCIGQADVAFTGMSAVIGNTARTAAGISMQNGCDIGFYSENKLGSILPISGIVSNRSLGNGGGVRLAFGGNLFLFGQEMCIENECLGSNSQPIYVFNNKADDDDNNSGNGGGLYLEAFNNQVYANGVIIAANSAGENGGGAFIAQGSHVTIERQAGGCWENDRCNFILANTAGTNNGFGGAFYIDDGELDLSQSYVEESRADFGTAIYATGKTTEVTVEGTVFSGNGDQGNNGFLNFAVINASFDASVMIKHSTFADNNAQNAVFDVDSALGGFMSLESSIVADDSTGDLFSMINNDLIINCLVAHENTSFIGTNVVVDSPSFIDAPAGDFHLAPNSPAIDLCQEIVLNKPLDMDNEPRGWDDQQNDNGAGVYDAGADESYVNDVIFKNGFENILAS